MARRREVALQVDAQHRVPLVLLHVHEHAVAQDARVVDEDVQPAEAIDGLLDHAPGAAEVRDVLAVRDRLAAERLDLADDVVRRALDPCPRPASDAPRSLTTIFAPAAASASACSRPIPRPAPVTIATFPLKSGMSV